MLARRRKEVFYLTMHSTHLLMIIWRLTTQIEKEETRYRHMGYSFRLAARVLLYAPSHRQDSTYHSLCYTNRGTLAGTRNSSMGLPDDPSHHARTLLPQGYISLLLARGLSS